MTLPPPPNIKAAKKTMTLCDMMAQSVGYPDYLTLFAEFGNISTQGDT